MGLFGQKKPRITQEIKDDWTLFNIGYYQSKKPEEYRQVALHKLMASREVLAVINTRFMYDKQKVDYLAQQQMLISNLEASGIGYKVVQVKRKRERTILGVSVAQSSDATYMDPVMGLVVGEEQLDTVIHLLKDYSVYYYIGAKELDLRAVLERLSPGLDHVDVIEREFSHRIFDDNFVKSIAVYCPHEDADRIKGILGEQ